MESRLPKRNLFQIAEKRLAVADNQIKFEEAGAGHSSRNPQTVNANPPLFQSFRFRATSPDGRHKTNFESRRILRRSRSHNDLQNIVPISLKRSAAMPSFESIPSKLAKTVTTAKPTSAISSSFRKPLVPTAAVAKTISSGAKNVLAATAKVPVKRIPSYDYKARFNDLTEKHKIVKEKLNEALSQAENYDHMEQTLATTQTKMVELERIREALSTELEHKKILNNDMAVTIESLKKNLAAFDTEKKKFVKEIEELTIENRKIRPELEQLKKAHELKVAENVRLERDLATTKELLFQSNLTRKDLHNEVLDLKGNIRVFCRVRPSLDSENNRMICGWNYMDETSLEISSIEGGRKLQKHEFSFDQVFHPQSSQLDIFELVSPLIQSAFDGYNVCIFAYGQTGSGKTYTMEGSRSQIGIIPRTVDLLFEAVQNYRHQGWSYAISVTFLEIYNEVLYDLLSNEQKELEIRMVNPKTPQEVTVSNLTEFMVETGDDLRELIEIAKSHRATAATVGNERSSRSHAVTQIKLVGTHDGKGEKCVGKINLIDLAGSESPKTSNRMDETKNINRSLSELTNVIMALLNHNDHVPYRNSKLTHLLMPSLGGNSKTLMFINVSPFEDCFKESVKSLRFAASVNACKMGKVKKNKLLLGGNHAANNSMN